MLALIAALFCVFANAFFVAAKFALARVRPTALQAKVKAGDTQAKQALRITKQLDAYLTATQLGITLASLALGWLGEPAVAQLLEKPLGLLGLSQSTIHGIALAVAFLVISLLHIVVGELVPKSLAILHPVSVSRVTSGPMMAFYFLMYPILYFLSAFSNYLLKRTGFQSVKNQENRLSPEEIRLIVRASFRDDENQGTKRDLLERVLRATDRSVRALMVPRVDMVVLSLSSNSREWLEIIRKTGFSRYPVSEDGDPDEIVGYVHAKDMLLAETQPKGGVRALKRDVLFVPESCSVGDILTQFQRTRIPIAIVVDEYGGTSGLVTVKDVVEEFVGDLRDEFDANQPKFEKRHNGTVIVDGSLPLAELPIDGLDHETENSDDTIGGYIITNLGRLARPGDYVRFGKYEITVEDVRRRRIERVVIKEYFPTIPPPSVDHSDNSE